MVLDNIVRLCLVSISYLILVLGLAAVIFYKIPSKRSFTERIILYFITGNFYVMNVIYLLLFLRCTSRAITIITLLAGAVGLRYLIDRKRFIQSLRNIIGTFSLLAEGIYGWNFFRREKSYSVRNKIKNLLTCLFHKHLLETLGFVACFAINAYYVGYRFVNYSTFGIYDESVHLEWIQFMLQGQIYYDGAYPFGFHNIIYAIVKVFGFTAFTGTRYFGFIMTVSMVFMMYALVKKLFKSAYLPIIGLFLYSASNIYNIYVWDRIQFSLPQEFGILFLYPMLIFLHNWINKQEQKDLYLFGICFTATLYIHYYVTIIALVLCFCVGVSYFVRIVKEKQLIKLLICGILSVIIGVMPLGVGLVTGHDLQGSLYWAINVIRGIEPEKEPPEGAPEEVKEEQPQQVKPVGVSNKILFWANTLKTQTQTIILRELVFNIVIGVMLIIVIRSLIHIISPNKRTQTNLQFSVMLYTVILLILMSAKKLGLPVILEDYRISVFLTYIIPVLLCIPIGYIYELFEKRGRNKAGDIIVLTITILLVGFIYKVGYTRELSRFTLVQHESAVKTFYKIAGKYEDYKWTIVSTVDEYSVVLDHGRHYEWIDFLDKMEGLNNDSSIKIPTEDVFFFIEKRPLVHGSLVELNKGIGKFPEFTQKEAEKAITDDFKDQANLYYVNQRNVIMAKAYYWAKQYKYYFPREMSVFYEDDNFVCYRLKQDTNYLNNLAVDYKNNVKK